jgi:hypothetical protein
VCVAGWLLSLIFLLIVGVVVGPTVE